VVASIVVSQLFSFNSLFSDKFLVKDFSINFLLLVLYPPYHYLKAGNLVHPIY